MRKLIEITDSKGKVDSEVLKNNILAVNFCILLFGIPAILILGLIFRHSFTVREILQTLIISMVLTNLLTLIRWMKR